jgi:hypothetical protein
LTSLVLPAAVTRADDGPSRLAELQFSAIDLPAVDSALERSQPAPIQIELSDLRVTSTSQNRFLDGYLVPKLSRQLDSIAPAHPVVEDSAELLDYVLYDDLAGSAERRARKGAKQALESYLIESTALRTLAGSVEARKKPAKPGKNFDVGLGVAHWLPQVELRYRTAATSLRFRLGLHGMAGVSFGHSRVTNTRLYVAYDFEDEVFGLNFRLGF